MQSHFLYDQVSYKVEKLTPEEACLHLLHAENLTKNKDATWAYALNYVT